MIGALAERIPLPSSIATVEALACRRAVLFAMELSVFEATLEGDVEVVTKALQDGGLTTLSLVWSLMIPLGLLVAFVFVISLM